MTIRDYDAVMLVAVFCDDCGAEVSRDYAVPAGADSLDVARAHLQTHEGWETGHTGDYCPKCVRWRRKGDAEPEGDSNIMHIYPVGDGIEHDTKGDGCVCVPRADPVKRDDGSVAWLMVHHSLDGREIQERAQEAEEQAEQGRWQNFATVRRTQWCKCQADSWPHVWCGPDAMDATGHERVPPSLHWELGQFQDDARFIGIIPKPADGEPNTPMMWRHS